MVSAQARKGETGRTWFRSSRVFAHSARNWYFRTREGVSVGPYDTSFEAKIEARLLKELLNKCESDSERTATIKDFIKDGLEMGHLLNPIQSEECIKVVVIR
jgi:hypothetical protein